ncbi:hypothetical protein PsorP6_009311 [Peronosclerospora sorghi]|uniref:Uncharacterized protein n=1 Tax=Peronosclerospora sorghi TaxID=230839 RepID=A0ACC0VZA1_9STRA|nr:hypothetical protein PsorP6_009311 [Peronosclerospora sorghi]
MNRATKTRQEITPLRVPWLQHEQFPVTKLACSTDDGLVTSTKRSLIKIVQELKRGRANLDKQLAQLDNQLVVLSDYLDGKSSNMFPPQLIINVENEPESPAQSTVDGRRHCGAAVAGKFSGILNTEPASPTPAMVEDDLNSDSPCSTIGLWKYLHAYSFFKTITPEDMDQALQLEALWGSGLGNVINTARNDPGLSDDFEVREDGIDHHSKIVDLERYQEKNNSSKFATHDLDEFFKEVCKASQ